MPLLNRNVALLCPKQAHYLASVTTERHVTQGVVGFWGVPFAQPLGLHHGTALYLPCFLLVCFTLQNCLVGVGLPKNTVLLTSAEKPARLICYRLLQTPTFALHGVLSTNYSFPVLNRKPESLAWFHVASYRKIALFLV